MRRNVAQCNACGMSLKNTTKSRLHCHLLRCQFHKAVDSDRRRLTGNRPDEVEWITLDHQELQVPSEDDLESSTPTGNASKREDVIEIVEDQPNTSKKTKRVLNWEGFTKIFDENLERNVAQCSKCGDFVKNTSRIDGHRMRCQRRQGLDWNGFFKVYSESLKRNVAQCEACGAVVMNSTRMPDHWKKCPRKKPEERS